MEQLDGQIKEVVCYKNGFGVIKFQYGKTSRKAAGKMPEPAPGKIIHMIGEWEKDPKWGNQFKLKSADIDAIEVEKESIIGYLKSGFLCGIGPAAAQKIYDMYGENTISILESSPERLCEIPGITHSKIEKIHDCYLQTKQYVELASFLRGATKHQIEIIFQFYGANSTRILKDNIYKIVDDIYGIGFQKADQLAANCGIAPDAQIRIRAAILYVLQDISKDGHCYITSGSLEAKIKELLRMPIHSTKIEAELQKLLGEDKIVIEDGNVYLAGIYRAECQCAENISRILRAPANRSVPASWYQKAIIDIEDELGFTFTPEQKYAVEAGMKNKILLLTGGPGSGKTTVISAVLRAWNCPDTVLMLAPTGCAAYRIRETTGQRAYTIHKGLGFGHHNGKMCFGYDEENRLPYDLIIVDEATMPNIVLFSALLKAIRSGARLILVGDNDQLPAIGPGKVYEDLLSCGRLPVVRLQIGHRHTNGIESIVDRIKRGLGMHTWNLDQNKDFLYYEADSTDDIKATVVKEYLRLVNEYNIENVRCLTVLKDKMVSYTALNLILRDVLYPMHRKQTGLSIGDRDFYVGDRIMYQKENDYAKGVFNGELGTIKVIDPEKKSIGVQFDDSSKVVFRGKELRNIELSYATSIHKSMGSECKAVVIAYVAPPKMLYRNLLYTAVSRAKCKVILVGSRNLIDTSVNIVSADRRNTRLKNRIKI